MKQGANIVLILLMLVAVYSHYMVNDKFERIAPALVSNRFLFMNSVSDAVFQMFVIFIENRIGSLKCKQAICFM